MSYKTYENYKDSKVLWMGIIPQDWNIKRLKFLCKNLDNERIPISAEKRKDGSFPYYGATGIVDYVDDYIFDDKLVLIGEDGAPFFDSTKNVSFIAMGKIWVNNHAHVLKVNENLVLSEYLMHILNCTDYSLYIKGSTRDKLNQDQLNNIPILIPSLDSQEKIVNFLDRKTSEIDNIISKNKELISLLEEKKAALINQVVTNGLNHEVPMKDTGITWIGKIPQHWEIFNLNYFFNVTKLAGFEFSEYMEYIDNGEIIALRALNIKNNKLDLSNIVKISKSVSDKLPRSKLYKGDLIFSYVGTVGEVAIIDDDNTYHLAPNIAKISSKSNNINISYFLYYLSSLSGQREIKNNTSKTTQEVISMAKIRKLRVICPNLTEQDNIVSYLDKRISKIDKTIEKVQENIDLLNEYKASLIYHVVTGKIDVRDEV